MPRGEVSTEGRGQYRGTREITVSGNRGPIVFSYFFSSLFFTCLTHVKAQDIKDPEGRPNELKEQASHLERTPPQYHFVLHELFTRTM